MQQCDLQIGAYYRASDTTFADVSLASEPQGSFTTALNQAFPANMLNNTQPTGYPVGTGGASGINRVIPCTIAELPDEPFGGAPTAMEDSGIDGDALYIRLKGIPRNFTCSLALPDIDLSHADYNRTWDDLKRLTMRRNYIWVLHTYFLFKGFIESSGGTVKGFGGTGFERVSMKIKYLYLPTVSGSNKSYNYMSIV